LYYDTGFCQWVVKSYQFEILTYSVIFANALWTAFEIDYNNEPILLLADPVCQFFENSFCIYFLLEWCLRFGAFKEKRFCYKDHWFPFDTILCFVSVCETWVFMLVFLLEPDILVNTSSPLRLVRIARVIRMTRLSKVLMAMPELTILFKGMAAAFRALVSTLGLIGVIIFFFAILFRQLTRFTPLEEAFFPTMTETMGVLLLTSTAPDLVSLFSDLSDQAIMYSVLYYSFILLVSYIMLNLLVGVLVNVVAIVHAAETDQQTINTFGADMWSMVQNMDNDSNDMISKSEFVSMLMKPDVVQTLKKIDVDCIDLLDFTDQIFAEDVKEVSFDDLMKFIMSFRKTNTATVKDVVDVRRLVLMEIRRLEMLLRQLLIEIPSWGHHRNSYARESTLDASIYTPRTDSHCTSPRCK